MREIRHAQGITADNPAPAAGIPGAVQQPVLQPYRGGNGPYSASGESADAPAGGAGGPASVRVRGAQALPDRGGQSTVGRQRGNVQASGNSRHAAGCVAGHPAGRAAPRGGQQYPVPYSPSAGRLSTAASAGELPSGGQHPRRGHSTPAGKSR